MSKAPAVLVIASAMLLTLSPALGDDGSSKLYGISVTGECLTTVSQDRGAVTVSSSVVATDARKAAEQAVTQHEKVKAEIAALPLKDFSKQTLSMTVNEECDYSSAGQRTCKGYRATVATRFETSEIPKIGDIIGIASKSGTQTVSDLETFVSPGTYQKAREACLETATRNASAKAQKLAAGAGVSLGKLLDLSEEGERAPSPIPYAKRMQAASAEMAMASSPSIDTQSEDMRVVVHALYSFN